MSVRYYDEALSSKIKSWMVDQTIPVLSPEDSSRLFQILSYEKKDKPLTLPLISLSRDTNLEILNISRRPLTYDGAVVAYNEKSSQLLNAIPIRLTYQLDIFTKTAEEGDEYLRNFIFNIINFPRLNVNIPYNNINYTHMANITLDSTVANNTEIPQRIFPGQFTRWTLILSIDDAYLFSSPVKDNIKIKTMDIIYKESNNLETTESGSCCDNNTSENMAKFNEEYS